jgi:glyoxylase-like metal-dependent hydrolase (beta-lactamase superfamily II)/rhodanese-related sulfurtransferase
MDRQNDAASKAPPAENGVRFSCRRILTARFRRSDRLSGNSRSAYHSANDPSQSSREAKMIFRQLFDHTSSTYSYLLASRPGGEALIIDPVLEKVDRYLHLVKELDLKLVKAVDTHLHADHITGLGALRDHTHCITVMGEQTKADVVSMRLADGDKLTIEGLALDAIYTPGHTDDSYSFVMPDRVFTGDTLLIRGTGRTDFQNGNARQQYESIFNRLLKLPDAMLVYPAHDYKGDTVSTIGEEKAFNPRLQVKSVQEYVELMGNLKLGNPKMMDVAVPANMKVGLAQEKIALRGWSLSAAQALSLLGKADVALVDLRERSERERHGTIPGSLHVPYPALQESISAGGTLSELAKSTSKRLLFYCAFGERSAMAVQAAQDAGLSSACHLQGGIDAWKKINGPLEHQSARP